MRLPDDILLHLFQFSPECMFLLNKKYTLECMKYRYLVLDLQSKYEPNVFHPEDQKSGEEMAFRKLILLYGVIYPYQSMITVLRLHFNTADSEHISGYLECNFPNLQDFYVQFQWNPNTDERMLGPHVCGITRSILDKLNPLKMSHIGFINSNGPTAVVILDRIASFPNLTSLTLDEIPINLDSYKSYLSLTTLLIDNFLVRRFEEYTPMYNVKHLMLRLARETHVAQLLSILPNLESLEIQVAFELNGLEMTELYEISTKLLRLKFWIYFEGVTDEFIRFTSLCKLQECYITFLCFLLIYCPMKTSNL